MSKCGIFLEEAIVTKYLSEWVEAVEKNFEMESSKNKRN